MIYEVVHYLQHERMFGLVISDLIELKQGDTINIVDPSAHEDVKKRIITSFLVKQIIEKRKAHLGTENHSFDFVKVMAA